MAFMNENNMVSRKCIMHVQMNDAENDKGQALGREIPSGRVGLHEWEFPSGTLKTSGNSHRRWGVVGEGTVNN